MKVKIVFFDCDGTLMFGSPWVQLNKAMGISEELDKFWLNQFLKGEITSDKWTKNIEGFYRKNNLTKTKLEEILDLKNFTFNQEAYGLMEFLNRQNIQTAIISSGIDYYVKGVAKHFNIKYFKDNASFIFDENGKFVKIKSGSDDLDQKVNDIKNICDSLNLNPLESIFVGDAGNDKKAFEYIKRGILYRTKFLGSVKDLWANVDAGLLNASWKKVDNLVSVIDIIKEENAKPDGSTK